MAGDNLKLQRDAQRTRTAILAAAQETFSTRGYSDAGVRDITAAAGVNPALVSRYFGSKEGLFEAALTDLLDTTLLTSAPRESFGEAMVTLLTEPPARRNPLPIMLLACADPRARAITLRLLHELTLEPLARWFGAEEGASRAARAMLIASGVVLYRVVYPLAPLASPLEESMQAWLISTFQALADEAAAPGNAG